MSKILFFSQFAFGVPTLQYVGPGGENDVRTIEGPAALRKYVELKTNELTIQYGSYERIPEHYKSAFAKMIL